MLSREPFTPEEETAILRHLGYADFRDLAAAYTLGFPTANQPMFLVKRSWSYVSESARAAIRADLCELEAIDRQLASARGRLKATVLGEMRIDAPRELDTLWAERERWIRRLADDLGVFPNPYSQQTMGGGGGVSGSVIG